MVNFLIRIIIVLFVAALFDISSAHAGDYSIENIGTALQIAIPAYAAGMSLQEDGWQGFIEFTESYVGTMTTVGILKQVTHETRPNGADDHSFPSGHAASAFSGATFIHARYGWKRALIPYVAATFVAYSRVYSEWHYIHDVAASAFIAAVWSFFITDRYNPPITIHADTSGFQLRAKIVF